MTWDADMWVATGMGRNVAQMRDYTLFLSHHHDHGTRSEASDADCPWEVAFYVEDSEIWTTVHQ